ncbi:Gamma-glutamyl cyclotransferase gliK [Trichinella pseudospiralis]
MDIKLITGDRLSLLLLHSAGVRYELAMMISSELIGDEPTIVQTLIRIKRRGATSIRPISCAKKADQAAHHTLQS